MYRKFDVTENLILHSALFDDLNTSSDPIRLVHPVFFDFRVGDAS
jgi:hypothetical protein